MATHKVIQDIEAEDKFLGPLTLKQFIFAGGGAFFGWLCAVSVMKGFGIAIILFGPLMLTGFALAFPWSKDQPTDVWLSAKLKFHFGNKKRIWDQSGMQELVTITAPKKIERILTNNLSQHEVKNRLQALADTIDSRGWAVKNASLPDTYGSYSDRLLTPSMPTTGLGAEDLPDIFEARSKKVDAGLRQSANAQRQRNIEKLNLIRSGEPLDKIDAILDATYTPSGNSFSMPSVLATPGPSAPPSFGSEQPGTPAQQFIIPTAEEEQLLQQLRLRTEATKKGLHDRSTSEVTRPSEQPKNKTPLQQEQHKPVIINTNSNLSIQTLQNRSKQEVQDDGEVIISLR